MKNNEVNKKIKEIENELSLNSLVSNLNRARSINVGTAFGGTSEILMRGEGDRFLYSILQPVEVVELIHQLSANVGCEVSLKPRKDFASWREWKVSEAEKKHLNGWPPFANDMAVFQQLGASGFNEEEANKIMNLISNASEYANETVDEPILGKKQRTDGNPNIMISENDNKIHNKLLIDELNKVVYMAGGSGGPGGVIGENKGEGGKAYSEIPEQLFKKQKKTANKETK